MVESSFNSRRGRRREIRCLRGSLLIAALCALTLSGCSLGDSDALTGLQANAANEDFARGAGSPALVTKNTIRIPGEDAVGNAAGAALSVYPSTNPGTRPQTVTVVEKSDWRAAVASGVFAAEPLRAPMLLTERDDVPDLTESAFTALNPTGTTIPGLVLKPKAIVAGTVAVPEKMPRINLVNDDYEKLSLSIDALWTKINGGKPSAEVIITTSDPALKRFALPAGPLAAKTGSPIFFANRENVGLATLRAIAAHKKPRIYVVGPPRAISDEVVKRLKRFGRVTRIGADKAVENAIKTAIYADPITEWGWGIVQPGHGLVLMNLHHEMDVAAGTTLSAGAAFGPLLLNEQAGMLSKPLENYLHDIKPAYRDDPADGVYNRVWLLGNEKSFSSTLQAQVDKLAEIVKQAPQENEADITTEGL